ncbi:extracellular solute-binding protein [Calycomorphotria hydatis]|uniref:Iron uptake protein A1 n=1 Tax=Calycomorphotria hydatis TaxID=2528027 RepID=A0A517T8U2_9PLAN|nr:extracellular solute-binding protein [Calycomorphotria hydatis]QDT64802.1 Iron uptake protein A1 precursor [Calycomorphotria hydatis]
MRGPQFFVVVLVVLASLSIFWLSPTDDQPDHLVVYCSHDAVYAAKVIEEFEEQAGITVDVKYDTEATKSLGLVNLLIEERDNPRCDVFWNNQLLGTVALEQDGILEPYQGAGYERIPAEYKSAEGNWCGFGARLRVYILNTDELGSEEVNVEELLGSRPEDFVFADPLFGTTLTHYSVLWDLWGADRLKAWQQSLLDRGATMAAGNSMCKNLVANGQAAFGWTDTDDYFVAVDEGKPVRYQPVIVEEEKTIAIPNTVAIIRGTQNRSAAEQFVDFLLSEVTELKLAQSKSRQIPLGPVDESQLPNEVRELVPLVKRGIELSRMYSAREECMRWLLESR